MSLRNRIACMIAPALVRFARARALRSSLFVVAYIFFAYNYERCRACPSPGRALRGTPCGKDVVVTRGRRAEPS